MRNCDQMECMKDTLSHIALIRYCIVPFMDIPVDNKIVEYVLRCTFREGTVEFEAKDLVKVIDCLCRELPCFLYFLCFQERPIDDMPSDDEDEVEMERRVRLFLLLLVLK